MYLSNYIVFHGEKQGVEHQQNTQFLRSYFVSFNKSIGELRQMQKHFPQPMHKQNLLQKVLEFQDSARCPPDRLPFIERTAPLKAYLKTGNPNQSAGSGSPLTQVLVHFLAARYWNMT